MRISNIRRLMLWLMQFFLKKWVRLQSVVNQQESPLPDGSHTCYLLPTQSWTDAVILNEYCKENQLPAPLEPNPSIHTNSSSSIIFLKSKEPPLIYKKNAKDASALALEKLMKDLTDQKILKAQLVPVSIYWGRSPDKERSFWKIIFADTWTVPGLLRKTFMILIHGRNTILQIGQAVSLDQLMDDQMTLDRKARKILRIFRVYFRRKREALVGPDLSHRRTLVDQILSTTAVSRAIAEEAHKGKPLYKAEMTARKYANEIAADYSYSVISAYNVTLTWLWNQLYDGVQVHHMDKVHQAVNTHEIIYVPCHRSHIDYLLLSYVVHQNGLVPPHIAAGINLNFPIVGTILRKGGAFFMRRSFKGNPLYAEVFNEYLRHMIYKGFAMEYFIEGGRSRSGRCLHPKLGMLSMTVNNYLKDCRRPIKFVPVYFGYEKIFEGSTYIHELRGLPKEKESWLDIFNSMKKIKKNFGKVHVNFGDPIDINALLSDHCKTWREVPPSDASDSEWYPKVITTLSTQIMTRINESVVIQPVNLICLIVLSTPKQAMNETALLEQLNFYQALIDAIPYAENSIASLSNNADMLSYAEKLKIVERIKHPLGDMIVMKENQAVLNTYFRNNILHVFILPAAICFYLENKKKGSLVQIQRFIGLIYPLVQREFFLHWSPEKMDAVTEEMLNALTVLGIIEHSLEGYTIATDNLQARNLSVLSRAIHHTIERYTITLAILNKAKHATLTTATLETHSHLVAQKLSILQEFNAPEFFDKNLFKTLIDTLMSLKMIAVQKEYIVVEKAMVDTLFKEFSQLIDHSIIEVINEMT